ncbi:hypothetical protein BT63DRAFT_300736 [Microthyrium microscopicum]|uniref:PHD-type domain-containing protein n=1 Tax=Microthyrium microscopicum TaxID=703497 RepID=A0A6A6U855_9PEZI|nr:hypothetical protein BT63DRAFT_300736 [Microthyrium microscopicum]
MAPRKRTRAEAHEVEPPMTIPKPSLLDRIRSMSEFAALIQFLDIFGPTLKIQPISIEDAEQECLKPTPSQKLAELGLGLLKNISSHRGLNLEIFDEYTRRQYVAKAPENNLYGVEEEPKHFDDFDIFTKIRVLHQLTLWTFWNPDRMREKMGDIAFEEQALNWRMNPYGWDSENRTYFVFDHDRLYRQTDAPIPEPISKPKQTPRRGRASKRRRVSRVVESTPEDTADEQVDVTEIGAEEPRGADYEENFMGRKWECVAVSFDDFRNFIDGIKKSKDHDEKALCKRLEVEIIPHLQAQEEKRQRNELRRLKELENLQRLSTAKRSSRLASKMETKREQELREEEERKRAAELEMALKEQKRSQKMEEDRESRMMTREQRLKEREVKRILHEEELRKEKETLEKIAEEEANGSANGRISKRQLKADMEKRQKELEALQAEEDDWMFDCSVCGVHGKNWDDGSHSIACEKCNVWQHSNCHGIAQEEAEKESFHFICKECKNPVRTIKLNMGNSSKEPIEKSSPASIKKVKTDTKPPGPRIKTVKKKDPTSSSPPTSQAGALRWQDPATGATMQQTNGFNHQRGGPPNGSVPAFNGVQLPAPAPRLIYPGPPPSAPNVFPQPTQPQSSPPTGFSHHQPPANGHVAHQSTARTYQSPGQQLPVPYQQYSHPPPPQPQSLPRPSQQPSPIPSFSAYQPRATYHHSSSPLQQNYHGTPNPMPSTPGATGPNLNSSVSGLRGSSPGYSPTKQASPPRPSPTTASFGVDRPMVPPIALSPVSRPTISHPPVKNPSPPAPAAPAVVPVASAVPAFTTNGRAPNGGSN